MQLNFLLICYFDPLGLLTVQDSVLKLKHLSKHKIQILNLYPNLSFQKPIDLTGFHGVMLHNTVAYNPQTLYTLNETLALHQFDGIKVLFKQDEHIRSHEAARFIGETNIDLVLTCLPQHEITKVYPKALAGEVKFLTQYTSYISNDLIQLATSITYPRATDIAYRGSMQPLQCGILGYEKWHVGHAIQQNLAHTALNLDISSNWSNRIHGTDWIRFLLSTKATLGAESGSNLFDFTGEVEKKCQQFERKNTKLKANFDAFYHKAHREFLHKYENNVYYAQVSPRHFEAAATKTLQILYEGEYSGLFKPYKHYLPLKKDLSNIEEVQAYLADDKKRQLITDCAFEEIAQNPALQVGPFVEQLDEILSEFAHEKSLAPIPSTAKAPFSKKTVLLLVPHELHLNPRVQWLKKCYTQFANITCIGITYQPKAKKYIVDNQGDLHLNLAHAQHKHPPSEIGLIMKDYYTLRHQLSQFSNAQNIQYPNNSLYSPEARTRHQAHCKHIQVIDLLFRDAFKKMIELNYATPDLLVAFDLSSLLPAAALSDDYQIPLVYDTQQFGPHSNEVFKPFETDFWLQYEKTLLKYVDLSVTEQNNTAELLSEQSQAIINQQRQTEKVTEFDVARVTQKASIVPTLRKLVKSLLSLTVK